jgi:omega-6 fatty acid desaturase (delta-12 desaturase)
MRLLLFNFFYIDTEHRCSFWDVAVIVAIYKTTVYLESFINPTHLSLPHPLLFSFARFALWALYAFWTGLFATGLWVTAHECGHQAFSESKAINNTVGWILHSASVHLLFAI